MRDSSCGAGCRAAVVTLLVFVAGAFGAESLAGFNSDGDHWTYTDDKLEISGILLKPDGKGPFPAIVISHGLGGSARRFALPKARQWVQRGFVCLANRTARALRPAPGHAQREQSGLRSPRCRRHRS